MIGEHPKWSVRTILEKREGDINNCITPEERISFLQQNVPYSSKEVAGNLLLNEGMDLLLSLLTGQGGISYSNSTAEIGVGDNDVGGGGEVAVRTQTELYGINQSYKPMELGYPTAPTESSLGTGRSVKFKASWGDADANFTWGEWSIRNDSTDVKNLNRKVVSLGTKTSGTWTLEVEICLS